MIPVAALDPSAIRTPCLVIDLAVLERNIQAMQDAMDKAGVRLRPHAKTHKSTRIAGLQIDAGARGLTVATLGEAEAFAAAGFDDLFVAYPVWVAPAEHRRVQELMERASLRLGVDSARAVDAIADALVDRREIALVIEVDSGQHRSGCPPEAVSAVAASASARGLDVVGVFTHGGHAYAGPDSVADAADDEVEALAAAAAELKTTGLEVSVLSAGSTPTARRSARSPVTEERPGTYVFGDRQQHRLGACPADDIALTVLSTIVSTSVPDQFVVDAGSKTLSSDRLNWLDGFGWLPDYPDAQLVRLSEEHGVVECRSAARPQIGDRVQIVPNHVCSVVNLASELVLASEDGLFDRWPVEARR